MNRRTLLGMLTPSSNTALEPLTSAMLSGLHDVSAHFGRFKVTEISLRPQGLNQFDDSKILEAASLLADAKVDVIAWNGTSAGWLGFDADVRLCERITAATGIPATTSTLALNEILKATGRTRLGLVSPYTGDVQAKIVENFRREGLDTVAERHRGICVNWDFSEVTGEELSQMIAEVAQSQPPPQAITTYCTNLHAAQMVDGWERRHAIPVYDTISTAVWKSLKIAGVDPRRVVGWGSLFQEVA